MFSRNKIAMIAAEFLGTGVLTMVILSVSKSTIGIPYFVALAAGLALAAMVLVFAPISGAILNPAIVVGLWSARRMKTLPAIVFIAAELIGGICAYLLFTYYVGQHWANSGHYSAKVLVAEAVGTFVFSTAWAAASFNHVDRGKFAAFAGLGLTIGVLVASSTSSGLLNPAVALGMRMWGWGTYVLGPVLGAVIGFNAYGLLFATPEKKAKAAAKKK